MSVTRCKKSPPKSSTVLSLALLLALLMKDCSVRKASSQTKVHQPNYIHARQLHRCWNKNKAKAKKTMILKTLEYYPWYQRMIVSFIQFFISLFSIIIHINCFSTRSLLLSTGHFVKGSWKRKLQDFALVCLWCITVFTYVLRLFHWRSASLFCLLTNCKICMISWLTDFSFLTTDTPHWALFPLFFLFCLYQSLRSITRTISSCQGPAISFGTVFQPIDFTFTRVPTYSAFTFWAYRKQHDTYLWSKLTL